MEMSRQRLRTGVLEASTRQCPHCEGTGLVRTASSAGLSALRLIEDEAARGRGSLLTLRASQEAAFYVLNRKRADIAEIEERYGVSVEIVSDGEQEGARMSVEASGPPPAHAPRFAPVQVEEEEDLAVPEDIDDEEEATEAQPEQRETSGDRKRRRRRRGRRGRGRDAEGGDESLTDQEEHAGETGDADSPTEESDAIAENEGEREDGPRRRRSRRGRRGGRRGARQEGETAELTEEAPVETAETTAPAEATSTGADAEDEAAAKRTRRRPRARKSEVETVEATAETPQEQGAEEAPAKPKRTRRKKADVAEAVAEPAPQPEPEPEPEPASGPAAANDANGDDDAKTEPRRGGWWQRTFGE
jgi:ribonuclease E